MEIAEAQFAAQVPLVELRQHDPAFAAWIQRMGMPLGGTWDEGDPPAALVEAWTLADAHDARLQEIIDRHGWPGRSLVGEDGADAAWVIAQHADRHHEWRREWLPLVREAAMKGEADPRHFARLADRVALVDSNTQLYGTWAQRGPTGDVLFDPPAQGSVEVVDSRRLAIGLPSLDVDLDDAPGAAPYRYLRTRPAYEWPPLS
ncbi:MAG: hypothetical protein LC779_12615 [Actinobacteria bacterium]|nr:hypothetical protein [Actinomycetota bacterium]